MFTRFNDALFLASRDQFAAAAKSRRAVIVLTDGIDSGRGNTTLETALQALLQAQVTVYVVSNTQISRAGKTHRTGRANQRRVSSFQSIENS